ncbi:Endopolyphosphatase [Marasmius crinis-equi]|uniref:Endopolyphosphatase n=1 Tax=Marasmius crinis-equi TaxID=585013 RepID=A0ABR3FW14_9AGAR
MFPFGSRQRAKLCDRVLAKSDVGGFDFAVAGYVANAELTSFERSLPTCLRDLHAIPFLLNNDMLPLNLRVLFIVSLSFSQTLCGPVQAVFKTSVDVDVGEATSGVKPRKLHGRFLQITDMHPDPHYNEGSSLSKACHRKKPKKKKNRAGYYGSAYSLTNYTLDYLEKNWASQIDFVIWTGDNARHDNDRKLPRTTFEIYDLNRAVAHKMKEVFSKKGIPVVPSLGNNDVWPHVKYPRARAQSHYKSIHITLDTNRIWQDFIPFPYRQVFQRGAYYSVEVVPDQLAVVALNTMYFYDSNKAVNGCPYSEPNDPGNLQLDWLEVQLKGFRERGMQVWLTGHVPPSRGNYFPECYVRYVDLALRYQDTIVGHLYGHMNADHFFFVEAVDLELEIEKGTVDRGKEIEINGEGDLYSAIIDDFATLPPVAKVKLDEYAVINVSPPVVPNPYLPTFRIFSYNVSGNEEAATVAKKKKKKGKKGGKRKPGHHRGKHGDKSVHCGEEPFRTSWKCHLSNDSWHSDPESPSRKNQLWTPTGYAQYYIPDLDEAGRRKQPKFKLEYTTFKAEVLTSEIEPIPHKLLPKSLRNGTITKSKYAPYELEDLTVGSWYELAVRLGKSEKKKLGQRFKEYMYLETKGSGDKHE